MTRSMTMVCTFVLSASAIASEELQKNENLISNEKSIDGYGHCDQILEQSLFNRIIHNRAEYERQVLERHLLTLTEDQAYALYSKKFDEARAAGLDTAFDWRGIGGTFEGTQTDKFSEEEHHQIFREFKRLNSSTLNWESESSLITNYASYIRDPGSVNAWKECVTQRPETDVYCFGARDEQGHAYVSVQWVPYRLGAIAPSARISFDHSATINVDSADVETVALGSGKTFTVTNHSWNSAKPYLVNVNAEAYSGDVLIGNYTCQATVPPLELPVLELPQGPTDDEICEKERTWLLQNGKISHAEYQFFRGSNVAPNYKIRGNRRSTILGWNICSSVANNLRILWGN